VLKLALHEPGAESRPSVQAWSRHAGSANETRAALALACAWGYISEQQATEVDVLYDRVLALT
jgi:hypothetical protein